MSLYNVMSNDVHCSQSTVERPVLVRLFITNKQICGMSCICVLFIVILNLYPLFQICIVLELLLNVVLEFYLKWSLMSFAFYRVDLVTSTFKLIRGKLVPVLPM